MDEKVSGAMTGILEWDDREESAKFFISQVA
jgi:hypothetical protein